MISRALARLPRALVSAGSVTQRTYGLSRPFRSGSVAARKLSTMNSGNEPVEDGTAQNTLSFGPIAIEVDQCFIQTELSLGLVNLKPIVPGHVLILPRRVARRFGELTAAEVSDLWLTAQRVGSKLQEHFKADSLTYAIQDGPAAGQTVP